MGLEESQVLISGFPILPSYRNQNSMVLTQEQKYRTMEQDINKVTSLQSINNKGSKNIQSRKDSHFNNWSWETWTATCRNTKLEHSLISHSKIN